MLGRSPSLTALPENVSNGALKNDGSKYKSKQSEQNDRVNQGISLEELEPFSARTVTNATGRREKAIRFELVPVMAVQVRESALEEGQRAIVAGSNTRIAIASEVGGGVVNGDLRRSQGGAAH